MKYFTISLHNTDKKPLLEFFGTVGMQQQELWLLVRVRGGKLQICLGKQKNSVDLDSAHYITVHYKPVMIKAVIISSLCHISHSKSDLLLVHKPYNWTRARKEMCHTSKPLFDSHKLP